MSSPAASRADQAEHSSGRTTRAAKACHRCHRKKLRCFGGHPCSSCRKAHQSCDFPDGPADAENGLVHTVRSDESKRIQELEGLVRNILHKVDTLAANRDLGPSNPAAGTLQGTTIAMPSLGGMPTSDIYLGHNRYTASPVVGESRLTPNDAWTTLPNDSSVIGNDFTLFSPPARSSASARDKNQDSAEGRLALLARAGSQYSAPLRPLSFQPAHWENADHTRPPSPARCEETDATNFWSALHVRPDLSDDPLGAGWVDTETAEKLLHVFMQNCHPFLPILEVGSLGRPLLPEMRSMGAYLFTVVLAVATRFARRSNRPFEIALPDIEDDVSTKIRRLAYSHFSSSLFRRHQTLRDVQATLFLSGWGLHPGPEGPEAWMSTGHCGRLALRLGLHTLPGAHIDTVEGRSELLKLISRWKTWLCWYCFDTSLELGFGRPTTFRSEPNEDTFLALLSSVDLPDRAQSLYLIGWTKLTKITRAMWSWSQTYAEGRENTGSNILPLLTELNGQLDEWTTTWLWIGSCHVRSLGSNARLLKLQGEHVRLCLNALALKEVFADMLQQETSFDRITYIRKAAMAALDILQAFVDGVSVEHYLCFSIDYTTLIIGHASVFLIRLYLTPQSPIDAAVLLHYLDMATDLLEQSDMSVLGQGGHVGRMCRELCRVANVPLPSLQTSIPFDTEVNVQNADTNIDFFSDTNLFGDAALSDTFDLNVFLGLSGLDNGTS